MSSLTLLALVLALILAACAAPQAPDGRFSLTVDPGAVELVAGAADEAVVVIAVDAGADFADEVALDLAWPRWLHGSFAANPISSESALRLRVGAQAPLGTHQIRIHGATARAQATTTLELRIVERANAPTVSLSRPALNLLQGVGDDVIVTVRSGSAGSGPLALTIDDLPPGLSWRLTESANDTHLLTIDTAAEAAPGSYAVTVRATGAGAEASAVLAVHVYDRSEERIIPVTTRVLSERDRRGLTSHDPEAGILRFIATPTLRELAPGDIVIGAPTAPFAPGGFFGRVTSVREVSGALVVTTEPAPLSEAILRGSSSFSLPLTPADLARAPILAEGVRFVANPGLSPQAGGELFDLEFDKVIHDQDGRASTSNDRLSVSGFVRASWVLDGDVDIDWFDVDVRFEAGIDQRAEVRFVGDIEAGFDREIVLAEFAFAAIQIPGLPIWITPEVELVLGVDGEIRASVAATVRQALELRLGFEYDDGFRNLSRLDSDFDFVAPQFSQGVEAEIGARLEAEIDLLFYGVAGVTFGMEPSLGFEARLPGSPGCRLYAKLKAYIGVEIDLWFWEKEWEKTVHNRRYPLFEGCNFAPEIDIVAPADDSEFFADEEIVLQAESTDLNEADFRLPRTGVKWYSSIDGYLGFGHVVTADLTPGAHIITVEGADPQGLADDDSIFLTVSAEAGDVPAPVIASPAQYEIFRARCIGTVDLVAERAAQGEGDRQSRCEPVAIELIGSALDPSDGRLSGASLVWTTSRKDLQDPFLGTGERLVARLAPDSDTSFGSCTYHVITLTATDSDGNSRGASHDICLVVGHGAIDLQITSPGTARVEITSPTGFTWTVTESALITGLAPGTYLLSAGLVHVGCLPGKPCLTYWPWPEMQRVEVEIGEATVATIVYKTERQPPPPGPPAPPAPPSDPTLP